MAEKEVTSVFKNAAATTFGLTLMKQPLFWLEKKLPLRLARKCHSVLAIG